MCICVQRLKRNRFTCVFFNKDRSKYLAYFIHEQKRYHCGTFSDELEAAQAVNLKCAELDIPLKNPKVGLPENKPEVRFFFKTKS